MVGIAHIDPKALSKQIQQYMLLSPSEKATYLTATHEIFHQIASQGFSDQHKVFVDDVIRILTTMLIKDFGNQK